MRPINPNMPPRAPAQPPRGMPAPPPRGVPAMPPRAPAPPPRSMPAPRGMPPRGMPAPPPRGMPPPSQGMPSQGMGNNIGSFLPKNAAMPTPQGMAGMKKGGKVSSASNRADGCATKGKTKGRIV